MDFLIGATSKNLMMVEGESKECSEEDFIKALEIAHDAIRKQITAQEELRDQSWCNWKTRLSKACYKMKKFRKKCMLLQKIKY